MALSNYRCCVGCARIGCSKIGGLSFELRDTTVKLNSVSRTDSNLLSHLYKADGNLLCDAHTQEYVHLFPVKEGQCFRFEHNALENCIDYYTIAKTVTRMPERVFSIKPTTNGLFEVSGMMINGCEVASEWSSRLLNKFAEADSNAVDFDVEMSMMNLAEASTPIATYTKSVNGNITVTPLFDNKVEVSKTPSCKQVTQSTTNKMFAADQISSIRDLFFLQEYIKVVPNNVVEVIAQTPITVPNKIQRSRSSSSIGTVSVNGQDAPIILISIEGNIGAGKRYNDAYYHIYNILTSSFYVVLF